MNSLEILDLVSTSIGDDFRSIGLRYLENYIKLRAVSSAYDKEWMARGEIEKSISLASSFVDSLSLKGSKTSIRRIDGLSPLLIVDIEASPAYSGDNTVLIYGHIDKQPATSPWDGGSDPFEPRYEGDRLYGRGVVDDGYSIVAAGIAIANLQRIGLDHPRIKLLIEASEESGSIDLPAHIEALGNELDGVDLVICLDSGGFDNDRLWRTTSLRGNIMMTVDVAVLEHGVHSGSAGGVVPSSFRILRRLLERVEDSSTGSMVLPQLYCAIPSEVVEAARSNAIEANDPLGRLFPLVDGIELPGEASERLLDQSWRPSMAFVGIDNVPSVAEAGNVLRSRTTAKLSFRIPPMVDGEVACEAIVRTLSEDPPYGAHVTVTADEPASGWFERPLPPNLIQLLDEVSLATFGKPSGACGEGGTIPFLAMLNRLLPKASILATGVLTPASNAHGPNEWISIEAAMSLTKALAVVLGSAPFESDETSIDLGVQL